jgi:GWxTD domain-containing protein
MTALALVFVGALITPPAAGQTADWAKSPEAYFLTAQEKHEWKTLRSEDARQQFRVTYWKRRDPTPGTNRNEFQELVLGRIRTADAEFTIGKTPGSRSAQGLVFVVLGPPSSRQQTIGPIKGMPDLTNPGRISIPNDAFDTTEFLTWVYDRATSTDLLGLLEVPSLEVSFVVEPGRRDEIRNAVQFQEWRELIARHTIAVAVPGSVQP